MAGPRATSSARPPGVPASTGPDDRFERSVRRWMRAYPRRWRETRGEELSGVLRDLTGPDAGRLGARAGFDLVRGGWGTRWREHPPPGPWLAYRLFDRELPQHRAWVRDDIEGALYGVRSRLLVPAVPAVLAAVWTEGPARWLWIVVTVAALLAVPTSRQRMLTRHLTGAQGGRVYGGLLSVERAPRSRVEALSGLRWLVGCVTVVALASLVAVLRAPLGTWVRPIPAGFETGSGPITDRWALLVTVLLACAVGLGLAVPVRRRVRGLVRRSDRPYRAVRPVSRAGAAALLALTAVVVTETGLETIGALVLGPGVVVACVAATVLPGAVTALAVLRSETPRGEAGAGSGALAAVDVWRAVTRAPLLPDAPVPVLVPVPVAARDGAARGSGERLRGGLADA